MSAPKNYTVAAMCKGHDAEIAATQAAHPQWTLRYCREGFARAEFINRIRKAGKNEFDGRNHGKYLTALLAQGGPAWGRKRHAMRFDDFSDPRLNHPALIGKTRLLDVETHCKHTAVTALVILSLVGWALATHAVVQRQKEHQRTQRAAVAIVKMMMVMARKGVK